MPETFGSITSSSTRSGATASNRSSASTPSRATWTRKPSRCSPTVSASTNDSSSSTTSTVGSWVIVLILPPRWSVTPTGPGPAGMRECERGALALVRLHPDLAAVVGGDVADDRQAETGAAGLAAAGPVDPVEALEDALEVALGDADAVVGHGDLDPLAVGRSATRRSWRPRRSTSPRSRGGWRSPTRAAAGRRRP